MGLSLALFKAAYLNSFLREKKGGLCTVYHLFSSAPFQILTNLALIVCRLSISVPSISTNALSYGAFYGLYANMRYQMLCGLDRSIVHHFDVLGVAMFFSTAIRYIATNDFYVQPFVCTELS